MVASDRTSKQCLGRVEADTTNHNSAISACENCGKWFMALRHFGVMVQSKIDSDAITSSTAIGAREKDGEWDKVIQRLSVMMQDQMEPTQ